MAPHRLETGAQCWFNKFGWRLFISKFSQFVFYLSLSLSVISKRLAQLSNHSVSVVFNARFATNGMYVKNNTDIYVSQTSKNRMSTTWDLYCCLLPVWSFAYFPPGLSNHNKVVLWPGCEGAARCNLHKRMCDRCSSLQKGGDVVATSQLMLRWKWDSPQMGCAQRATHKYIWREQTIIEWSRRVISIIACCHSLKLCAISVQAFWSQHKKYTFLSFACIVHANGQRWTCSWI